MDLDHESDEMHVHTTKNEHSQSHSLLLKWDHSVTLFHSSLSTGDSYGAYVALLMLILLSSILRQRMIVSRMDAITPLLLKVTKDDLLFAAHSLLSYLLMLATMSMNVGIILSIVLGLTIGRSLYHQRELSFSSATMNSSSNNNNNTSSTAMITTKDGIPESEQCCN